MTGCFGPQPCFGGCGFSSQMDRGRHPVSGQREGRREEGIGVPPGGLTPHASVLQQISQLVGKLNMGQTRELQQMLAERTRTEGRQLPEFFWGSFTCGCNGPFYP